MADATIGALSVILGGDASALDKMLAGAKGSVNSFAKDVAGIAGGIGLEKLVSGAVSSFVDSIEKALADIDALSKLSDETPVDELSRLKYAADLSGVSFDALGKATQSLSNAISDVAGGKVSAGAAAITSMGLSVRGANGEVKTATQLLGEIADKFTTYKDGATKAALAQTLFGDGGSALITMLNKGSAGLAALGGEAEKFGLVLDQDTKERIETFNTNLAKMDAIKQGLYVTIASRLSPALEDLSQRFLDAKENSSLTNTAADITAKVVAALAGETAKLVLQLSYANKELQAWWNIITSIGDYREIGAAFQQLNALEDEITAKTQAMRSTFENVFTDTAGFAARWSALIDTDMKAAAAGVAAFSDSMAKVMQAMQRQAPAAINTTLNALDEFLARTAKQSAAATASAETVGKGAEAQARLRVEYEASAIALAKNITVTDEYRQKIDAAAETAAAAAAKLAGAQLTQANLTPMQQRNQLLAQYNTLLQQGAISTQTFAAASLKVQFPNFTSAALQATDFKTQLDTLATSGVQGLSNAFAQFVTGQATAAQAFQQFATQFIAKMIEMVAQALIFKAIMTAIGFAGGGPVSSAIGNPLQPSGLYAGGGMINGPGTATSDSIPAMLSNGEYVINAASTSKYAGLLAAINEDRLPRFADGGGVGAMPSIASLPRAAMRSRQAVPVVPVVLKGFAWSREQLADLINGLNGMHRNGYKLKAA